MLVGWFALSFWANQVSSSYNILFVLPHLMPLTVLIDAMPTGNWNWNTYIVRFGPLTDDEHAKQIKIPSKTGVFVGLIPYIHCLHRHFSFSSSLGVCVVWLCVRFMAVGELL